jgi:heme O synthase-like polyprenyltransferase
MVVAIVFIYLFIIFHIYIGKETSYKSTIISNALGSIVATQLVVVRNNNFCFYSYNLFTFMCFIIFHIYRSRRRKQAIRMFIASVINLIQLVTVVKILC